MKKITVLGFGSWGTALSVLLSKNGHSVLAWTRETETIPEMLKQKENYIYLPKVKFPENLNITDNFEEACKFGEIVIFAVPSKAIRPTAELASKHLNKDQILVNVAKGLEDVTYLTLSDVIKECVPQCEVTVLSGPSHAEEVGLSLPTTCVIASENEEIAYMLQEVFMSPVFRVYTNTDVIGVEIGAALKNVIALAAGISDGLGYGDNAKAALMTRGIAEIARLGITMGGNLLTFSGLSGVGDLIVTCTSMHSRNRRAGILLGQGKSLEETLKTVGQVVEGVNTAKAAYHFSQKYNVKMPITEEINKVLFEGKDPKVAVLDLMMRKKISE